MAILQTHRLSIGYRLNKGDKILASGLDLRLEQGSFVALLGPNGSGKSTLIKTLCSLLPPLSGEISIAGQKLHRMSKLERARNIAVVLTDAVQTPGLSVYDMVSYGRFPHTNWLGKLHAEDAKVIEQSLQSVGMQNFGSREFLSLSDGEKQRVMIAKALAQQSDLMILDEPTAHLDLINRVEIMKLLRQLAHEQKRAILISTHELDLAMQSADRLWLMNSTELVDGMPEELILNGAMQQVFARSEVDFDHLTGMFRIRQDFDREIHFDCADEQIHLWTERALEKKGIRLVSNGSLSEKIVYSSENKQWVYTAKGQSRACASLEDLVAVI